MCRGRQSRSVVGCWLMGILLLVAGCSATRYTVNPADLEGVDRVELPLEFTGADNHFSAVTARIRGRDCKLMIDTGDYAALSLNTEVLDALDVQVTSKRLYSDMTGRSFESRDFIVPCVQLGSLTLTGVPGRENANGPRGFDGTVGRALLANFYALFDYRHGKLTLLRKDTKPAFLDEGGWIQYDCAGDMQFQVRFDGLDGEYRIGLDSGMGLTFVRKDSELGRAMRSALRPNRITEGTVNSVPAKDLRFYKIRHVLLGEHDLGPTTCLVGPAARYMGNGTMGFDFFRNNAVLIDFVARRVWIKPAEDGTTG